MISFSRADLHRLCASEQTQKLKFLSNVIEICFGAKCKAIDKIFLGELVFHQYGNYVLQREISSIVDNGLIKYKHGKKVV